MRSEGYELGSALTFVVLFNLGGIVGMLIAGRASDRFGAPRISAIWCALTAAGVFRLSVHMPLALTFTVAFLTGVFLNSAQTMIYAIVSIRSTPAERATAVGWTSGMGRFGAVFGPWLGGQLLAADHGDWGFTAFALAGVSSMVFTGLASLRGPRTTTANAGKCSPPPADPPTAAGPAPGAAAGAGVPGAGEVRSVRSPAGRRAVAPRRGGAAPGALACGFLAL
jgi:AAHS family benzoate transporter-like MFS transporter